MNLLLLVPALISLVLVIRGRAKTAFLWVYLSALLLLPEDYSTRLPHLPELSVAEFALIPIGLVALFRVLRSGSIKFMDVLVTAYIVSITATEVTQERILNDGIFMAITSFIAIFLAYFAGRAFIEPDDRLITARRVVLLFLLTIPFGVYEWRFGMSPLGLIGQKILFLSDIHTGVFIRNGRGRMGGAFTFSEIAGIAFGMTVALNGWLLFISKKGAAPRLGPFFTKLEKYHIPGLLLLMSIWLSQSRGPLMSVGAAYLILQIPKFKNTKLATFVVVVLLGLATLGAQMYFDKYTSVSYDKIQNEQQGSALYRREMNENYKPVAEKGGWLGWGIFGVPSLSGHISIDNEYLRVHLVQGKFGYYILLLICAESIRVLLVRSWTMPNLEDRAFVFSMLGAMTVLWVTLYTVYMGQQLPQFAFLMMGWCQSIRPGAARSAVAAEAAKPKFAFQRVLQ